MDELLELEDQYPRHASPFNDDDLVMYNSEVDDIGGLYLPMGYEEFKAMFELDMAWVADTVAKMASEVQS